MNKRQKATVDGFMGKIELAQRLKETRDICRKLDPEGFASVTAELRRQLRDVQQHKDKSAPNPQGLSVLEVSLAIANKMTETGDDAMAMWVIAAAVEECEAAGE